jgi:predicted MPP superfamily phosphohydrolase
VVSTIGPVGALLLVGLVIAGIATVLLAWGWFEAGWVRFRRLDVELPGLAPALDGLRVVHLSDFHLGTPSRGERAVASAVAWTSARKPDIVCVTGDLLARARGEARLRELLSSLDSCYVILGNHDIAISRDPFSRGIQLSELAPATLLTDAAVTLQLRGRTVLVAGADPASRGREPDLSADADLRILLVHFPDSFDGISDGRYDLVLSGHMHDGQICIPFPGGKLRLAHPVTPYPAGLYRRGSTAMYVSPGLGTSFVPFRFFARPEATELTLRSAV